MEDQAIEALTFKAADYIVWALILCMSLSIGVYYACSGGRQRSTEEFLVGNRSMNPIPVALSISVSFISAITFLGTTSESFTNGVMIVLHVVAVPLAAIVTAVFFLPMFRKLEVTSANEYLELRFDKSTRRLATFMLIFNMFVYMGVVLYGPALALNQVAGLNVWGSVLSIGVVCTFYTTVGGFKAVIWTDVFQMLIMVIGLFAVIAKGSVELGGFANVVRIAGEGQRLNLFDFRADLTVRHTFWGLVVGAGFMVIALFATNQAQVQRYLSCSSTKTARIALGLGAVLMSVLVASAVAAGLVMYAYYADCDPVTLGIVPRRDQMIPYFTMELFKNSPGLPGLFLSAVFSASLSTISSGLNAIAAVTTEDIIKPFWPGMSDLRYTQLSKLCAVSYGTLVIGFAFLASVLGDILSTALNFFGIFGGPTLGLFSCGFFIPWVNPKGAIIGTVLGLTFSFWVGLGSQVNHHGYPKPPVSISGCDVTMYNATSLAMTDYVTTDAAVTFGDSVAQAISEGAAVDVTSAVADAGHDSIPLAIYKLSYTWLALFSMLFTMTVAVIVSLITGPTDPRTIDPRLICPFVENVICCLPERWKIKMRCRVGEHFDEKAVQGPEYQKVELREVDDDYKDQNENGDVSPTKEYTRIKPDQTDVEENRETVE